MKKVLSIFLSLALFISFPMTTLAKDKLPCNTFTSSKYTINVTSIDTNKVCTKILKDLNGNIFTLTEIGTNGYYIYDNASGKYLEMSDSAPSPYESYYDNLYYFGPLCYYVKTNNQYIHTITHDTMSKATTVLSNQRFTSALSTTRTNSLSLDIMSTDKKVYVPNYNYIKNAVYPANENGTCGYTAACLLLYYWHKTNGGIIPSTYLNNNGQLLTSGYTLQNKLLSYGHSDSSWGKTIRDVLIDYCNEYNISATSYYYFGKLGVSDSIKNGHPAIVFGLLTSTPSPASIFPFSTTGKVSHLVTLYGISGNYYICHYGWSGYSHVLLDSGLIGSCTLFQLN